MQLPHENLYTNWDCNSLGITYLKRKREDRRFVELRTILILHCGNEFFKQVLNFCFKLDDNVLRYGSTIESSFLGTDHGQRIGRKLTIIFWDLIFMLDTGYGIQKLQALNICKFYWRWKDVRWTTRIMDKMMDSWKAVLEFSQF